MGTLEPLCQVRSIAGGLVFWNNGFARTDVLVDGDVFGDVGASCGRSDGVLDASGCYVIPGLVDIHFHGCLGDDLSDASTQGLHRIARYEASRGVTSICPATMTLPHDKLMAIMGAVAAFTPQDDEAALAGVNMEGPFISPDKVGAQNPAYVRPADPREFRLLQQASGNRIRLVDVAPETPGCLNFIKECADESCISVAHTNCTYEDAEQAFLRGARHMTHLFNAMPPLHHRKPGPVAAGAERDDVSAEVITDGVHVHPSMVRLAFVLFGRRTCIISDSLRACGLPDGTYELGGQQFFVNGPFARLADGTLAGSVSDLMSCMVTAVELMEIPLEDAVAAASEAPARAIGMFDRIGSIAPGKQADAVVLDRDLAVRHVVLRGKLLI